VTWLAACYLVYQQHIQLSIAALFSDVSWCGLAVQVGAFPHYGNRWSEWNGRFRDTVRNFIKVGRT
jgi:pullulanase/glycogen debranching enzyme